MPNSRRDSGARLKPKITIWLSWLSAFAILAGAGLVALYLPLPPARMPIASEIYDIRSDLIATFYSQNRRPAKLDEIPAFLQQAFLAVEDHRFYRHHGLNPGRIFKAALFNLTHRRIAQGASTITQQLAKNAYLTQKRSFIRKFKELYYTLKLEIHCSKSAILERYLNQIYFGHGAYGIKVAAATYFRKNLGELNQAEMALLAGLPRGPAFYSPYTHPQAAKSRLANTLRRMRKCGFITTTQYHKYLRQPLTLPGLETQNNTAPYFVDLLQKELVRLFPGDPELLYNAGLRIESTLDPGMQKAAQNAMKRRLPRLYHNPNGLTQPQGALIALDHANGEIRALIGGTDFNKSQFNRASAAKRQPGSAFKPILYAAALSHGFTLASRFDRAPQTYLLGAHTYRPTDHADETASGTLTLRDALACSSNVVAVKLLEKLGFDPVIDLAIRLGIRSKLAPLLSLALGSQEVTPLELAGAYLPIANGGLRYRPVTIRRVLDRQGRVLYRYTPAGSRTLDPGVAFLVTQALTGVFKPGGTAANIGAAVTRPAAGKTGTTENNRDAWFVGYTPDLLAAIFVGCDHNERKLPGGANRVAAPIWADFIAAALKNCPVREFPVPANIKAVTICQTSGQLATPACPKKTEYFLAGTEPTAYCSEHRIVQLKVCKRSGLLPGPYCQDYETRIFPLAEAPTAICDQCRRQSGLFEFFRKLFRNEAK
ncbi:MAG: PBP1A family penicillin-binding protein [Bacillota bacterium]|jgi:1A family penicillin-binding protein